LLIGGSNSEVFKSKSKDALFQVAVFEHYRVQITSTGIQLDFSLDHFTTLRAALWQGCLHFRQKRFFITDLDFQIPFTSDCFLIAPAKRKKSNFQTVSNFKKF